MNSAETRRKRIGLIHGSAADAPHLKAALVALGLTIAWEAPLAEVSSGALRAFAIDVVIIALDDDTDLARIEQVLTRSALPVIFDDVATSGALDGWDRARWQRHLGIKIAGAGDAIPERPRNATPIPAPKPRPLAAVATAAPASGAIDSALDRHRAVPSVALAPAAAVPAAAVEMAEDADAALARSAFAVAPADDDAVAFAAGGDDDATEAGDQARLDADLDAFQDDPTFDLSVPADSDTMTAVVAESPAGDAWSFDDPMLDLDLEIEGDDEPAGANAAPQLDANLSIEVERVESFNDWQLLDADASADDSAPVVGAPRPKAAPDSEVTGLDELLAAMEREPVEADAPTEPLASRATIDAAPREIDAPKFDLSNLSLEPLEGEVPLAPLVGRAQFQVDTGERAPPPPIAVAEAAPETVPRGARRVWLLSAGEADSAVVEAFVDALPRALDALLLLTRPAHSPGLSAALWRDAGKLPLVDSDDTMETTPGRVVLLAPGERAGFSKEGSMTVQPGDYALPEALGDWMTLRALASRYGRDAGLIVFGKLRDEVLEGAIELARAGGTVWFESSVYAHPNPSVDAARAAGIAVRDGSAAELAAALAERLSANQKDRV